MLGQLRKMLQNKGDISEEKFQQFEKKLQDSSKFLQSCEFDILLRKAVEQKVPNFGRYYQLLIKKGANVNFCDSKDNKSNLMIACQKGNAQIVQILASDPKINFQIEDNNKQNALFYALNNRSKEQGERYIKIILEKQPKLVQSQSNINKTLLFSAIQKQRFEIVKILLENKADPNKPISDTGNTPLHEAVKTLKSKNTQNIRKIIKVLIQKNANHLIKNKQNKDVLQLAQKCQGIVKEIICEVQASKIKKQQLPISQSESSDESQGCQATFEQSSLIFESLTQQICNYQKQCNKDYNDIKGEVFEFLQNLKLILSPLSLEIQLYGSFATGLWLKNCDIDVLLITNDEHSSVVQLLDQVYKILGKSEKFKHTNINKSVKVPIIRTQITLNKRNIQKVDITVKDINNNGQSSINYISNQLQNFPKIKPIFFIIKSLTCSYKLNDPKNGGIRTYALLIMIISYIQNSQQMALGQLLVRFLYYFGFLYEYQYILERENKYMVLKILEPLNLNNNVGKDANVYALQNMFKVAYIALHAKISGKKIPFILDTIKLFT